MKHKIGFNRLGRKASHRKSMVRNMVSSLFKHERIITTKTKALAVKVVAERMITRAKEDSVHNRRIIAQRITDEAILFKLFSEIGPRYKERPGGYTRILKLGKREGDAAEMVVFELVDRVVNEPKSAKDKDAKKVEKTPKVEKEKPAKADSHPGASEKNVKPTKAKTQKIQKIATVG